MGARSRKRRLYARRPYWNSKGKWYCERSHTLWYRDMVSFYENS